MKAKIAPEGQDSDDRDIVEAEAAASLRELADDDRLPVVTSFLDDLLSRVTDSSIDLKERAGWYAVLRPLRLRIDRALRPVTGEITDTMVKLGARKWGPLEIVNKSQDVKYTCNDLGNWTDDGVQSQLAEWRKHPPFTPYIREVPSHLEVDTIALRDDLQHSYPGAFELFQLLNDAGYRTTGGKKPTLEVKGG